MAKRSGKAEWEVIRLGSSGEYLGTVTAPDDEATVKVALKAFALNTRETNCLLVRRIVRR
jgi:hypothetical protein